MELNRLHGVPHPTTGLLMDPVVFMSRNYPGTVLPEHVSTTKSADELTAEAFSKPASADCILAHLMRMATFLTIKGTAKDIDENDPQTLFILSDFTTRLVDHKVREVDIFLACEYFIERNEDGFFPTIAKLLKHLGKGED